MLSIDQALGLKILGNDTRQAILATLIREERVHVTTLVALLGQSRDTVAYHLRMMELSGLVRGERDGHHVWYRPVAEAVEGLRAAVDQLLGSSIKSG